MKFKNSNGNLRNWALSLYAISGIMGSALAIYGHCRRALRIRREHNRDPYKDAYHRTGDGPQFMSYDAWRAEYDMYEEDMQNGNRYRRPRR